MNAHLLKSKKTNTQATLVFAVIILAFAIACVIAISNINVMNF